MVRKIDSYIETQCMTGGDSNKNSLHRADRTISTATRQSATSFFDPFWVSSSLSLSGCSFENLHVVHERGTAEQSGSTDGTGPHWHGGTAGSAGGRT